MTKNEAGGSIESMSLMATLSHPVTHEAKKYTPMEFKAEYLVASETLTATVTRTAGGKSATLDKPLWTGSTGFYQSGDFGEVLVHFYFNPNYALAHPLHIVPREFAGVFEPASHN